MASMEPVVLLPLPDPDEVGPLLLSSFSIVPMLPSLVRGFRVVGSKNNNNGRKANMKFAGVMTTDRALTCTGDRALHSLEVSIHCRYLYTYPNEPQIVYPNTDLFVIDSR